MISLSVGLCNNNGRGVTMPLLFLIVHDPASLTDHADDVPPTSTVDEWYTCLRHGVNYSLFTSAENRGLGRIEMSEEGNMD